MFVVSVAVGLTVQPAPNVSHCSRLSGTLVTVLITVKLS
jgi:hypothetical protein